MAYSAMLRSYEEYLKGQLVNRTVKAYLYDFEGFLRFIQKRSQSDFQAWDQSKLVTYLKNLRQPDFYAYLHHLKDLEGNTDQTANRKLTSLSSFYQYLIEVHGMMGMNPINEIPRYHLIEKDPVYLDAQLLQDLISRVGKRNRYRDTAILYLIIDCALKASQIASLKLDDYEGKYLKTEDGVIGLSESVIRSLNDYINMERKNTSSKYIFVSQKNDSISIRTIQHMIKKLCEDLQTEKHITPETIRNTTIVKLLKSNVDHSGIKRYFGSNKALRLEKSITKAERDDSALDFDFSK